MPPLVWQDGPVFVTGILFPTAHPAPETIRPSVSSQTSMTYEIKTRQASLCSPMHGTLGGF